MTAWGFREDVYIVALAGFSLVFLCLVTIVARSFRQEEERLSKMAYVRKSQIPSTVAGTP